ncbi:MAG: sugar ABC transporter permease [Clostridia bacterium]|nr:sugar ABC transporter permease [Clostridia bacterium]
MKSNLGKRCVRTLFGKTVEQRRDSMGYVFLLPWLIGLVSFFILPFFEAMYQMFYSMTLGENGVQYTYVGGKVFKEVLWENSNHIRMLLASIGNTLRDALLIVIFSLIVAILLNKPFRGRGFCRALMALPIIVSSGVLMQVLKGDLLLSSVESGAAANTVFQGAVIEDALLKMGLSVTVVNFISNSVSTILDLIWQSGIQILLFVGGMQAIPSTYYEVCGVEGASPWQSFWRVTFPMLTPFLVLNMVYAVIDSFTMPENKVIVEINEYFHNVLYSQATVLSMAYFVLVSIIVGAIALIFSRRAFYIEK